jgi:hypothetical protein
MASSACKRRPQRCRNRRAAAEQAAQAAAVEKVDLQVAGERVDLPEVERALLVVVARRAEQALLVEQALLAVVALPVERQALRVVAADKADLLEVVALTNPLPTS